jgi:hypothetical protein
LDLECVFRVPPFKPLVRISHGFMQLVPFALAATAVAVALIF